MFLKNLSMYPYIHYIFTFKSPDKVHRPLRKCGNWGRVINPLASSTECFLGTGLELELRVSSLGLFLGLGKWSGILPPCLIHLLVFMPSDTSRQWEHWEEMAGSNHASWQAFKSTKDCHYTLNFSPYKNKIEFCWYLWITIYIHYEYFKIITKTNIMIIMYISMIYCWFQDCLV